MEDNSTNSASGSSPPPAKKSKVTSSELNNSSNNLPNHIKSELQKKLEEIDFCQSDLEELNEKAREEILKVEMKYTKLRQPHFEKRNSLIATIENFWVTTILNHPRLANLIEEEEEECLHYLKQLVVEESEDLKTSLKVEFHFSSNPFLTNEVLTKTYYLSPKPDEPKSQSTVISWKANMDITKTSPSRFFNWFSQASDAAGDKVLKWIKNDLWPNPLPYYLDSEMSDVENGVSSDDDVQHINDDSVVIVGDDTDDDDDCYEVEGDDNDDLDDDSDNVISEEEFEETIESIEVEDDEDNDSDDDVQVLGSESEVEDIEVQEIPNRNKTRGKAGSSKPRESDSIDMIVAAAVSDLEANNAEIIGEIPQENDLDDKTDNVSENTIEDKGEKTEETVDNSEQGESSTSDVKESVNKNDGGTEESVKPEDGVD